MTRSSLRQLVSPIAASFIMSGAAAAVAQPPREAFLQHTIEDLYQRLVLDGQSQSKAFEEMLERQGGARVTGVVGEISIGPSGDVFIWLRHSMHGELVGRFRVPAEESRPVRAASVGQRIEITCIGVYRSYAQVSARWCTP